MGGGDTNKTAKEKEPKTPPTTATQEQSSAAATAAAGTMNPDWSGFQAYSPIPPHGFLASSPQAHPYMWGVQHIMPPYGTPAHPYVAMYPHGGVYAHPTIPPGSYPFSPFAMPANGIPEASGNALGTVEADSGPSDAKEKLPIKRSKESLGSLNAITGKNTDHGKLRGVSANGTQSKSAESGSEGTSEGSDANSQNDSQNKSGGGLDSLEGDVLQNEGSVNGSQNGQTMPTSIMNPSMSIMPISAPGAPALPGPTTNLNIGMDYWGAPASTSITPFAGGIVTAGSRDGVNSQAGIQDERELKRQRRKQSNRESARRSRLRKQAECDELAQRARALKEENDNLRAELDRLKSEYEKLHKENSFLKERLGEGQEDFKVGRSDQSPTNDTQQTG